MIIVAKQKYTRQTARKVRLVAAEVKKLPLEEALRQLAAIERRSTLVVLKTLRQAIANAMNNHNLAFADLEIKNILVDEAPTYKRWRAVSRGRAHTILKRSCHVKVELQTKELGSEVKKEVKVKEAVKTEKKVAVKKAATKKVASKKASAPKKVASKTKTKTKKVTKK